MMSLERKIFSFPKNNRRQDSSSQDVESQSSLELHSDSVFLQRGSFRSVAGVASTLWKSRKIFNEDGTISKRGVNESFQRPLKRSLPQNVDLLLSKQTKLTLSDQMQLQVSVPLRPVEGRRGSLVTFGGAKSESAEGLNLSTFDPRLPFDSGFKKSALGEDSNPVSSPGSMDFLVVAPRRHPPQDIDPLSYKPTKPTLLDQMQLQVSVPLRPVEGRRGSLVMLGGIKSKSSDNLNLSTFDPHLPFDSGFKKSALGEDSNPVSSPGSMDFLVVAPRRHPPQDIDPLSYKPTKPTLLDQMQPQVSVPLRPVEGRRGSLVMLGGIKSKSSDNLNLSTFDPHLPFDSGFKKSALVENSNPLSSHGSMDFLVVAPRRHPPQDIDPLSYKLTKPTLLDQMQLQVSVPLRPVEGRRGSLVMLGVSKSKSSDKLNLSTFDPHLPFDSGFNKSALGSHVKDEEGES